VTDLGLAAASGPTRRPVTEQARVTCDGDAAVSLSGPARTTPPHARDARVFMRGVVRDDSGAVPSCRCDGWMDPAAEPASRARVARCLHAGAMDGWI